MPVGEALARWVGQLLTLAVVFALLDLLQPEGSLKGPVRTVMGLALLGAVLGPVAGLVADGAAWAALVDQWRQPRPGTPAESLVDPQALQRTLWEEALAAGQRRLADEVGPALAAHGLGLGRLAWDASRVRVELTSGLPEGVELQRVCRELADRLGVAQDRIWLKGGSPSAGAVSCGASGR